jgi:hypothetical protein
MMHQYQSADELRRDIRHAERMAALALATPPDDWTTRLFAGVLQDCVDLTDLAAFETRSIATAKLGEALRQLKTAGAWLSRREPPDDLAGMRDAISNWFEIALATKPAPTLLCAVGRPVGEAVQELAAGSIGGSDGDRF